MPNLGETKTSGGGISTAKLLLLGDTKAGKTHWAMQAAEAGFNVLYLDGDVAIQTLMDREHGLSQAALDRVTYLNIADHIKDGSYEPFMAKFFVDFTTQGVVTWNDTKGRLFDRRDYEQLREGTVIDGESGEIISGDEIWQLRPSRLGPDTVLILDSWTTLVTSLQWWKANDLNIDLLEIEKLERDMYSGTSHKATQFLQLIRALRCHVIVIGHPREYQKKSVPDGSKGVIPEKEMKVDWTRMVPYSTSNPHALTMGKNFSDIGWIDVSKMGNRTIDFKVSSDRVIGGHFNERKPVAELGFKDLVLKIGGTIPVNPSSEAWLTRFPNGTFTPAGSKPAVALTGSGPATAQPIKATGLAGLMAAKKK